VPKRQTPDPTIEDQPALTLRNVWPHPNQRREPDEHSPTDTVPRDAQTHSGALTHPRCAARPRSETLLSRVQGHRVRHDGHAWVMTDEVSYVWRGPITDDEMVDCVKSQRGQAAAEWWDQIRMHSLAWVAARKGDGLLVRFVKSHGMAATTRSCSTRRHAAATSARESEPRPSDELRSTRGPRAASDSTSTSTPSSRPSTSTRVAFGRPTPDSSNLYSLDRRLVAAPAFGDTHRRRVFIACSHAA
jgi:hypothetical protein